MNKMEINAILPDVLAIGDDVDEVMSAELTFAIEIFGGELEIEVIEIVFGDCIVEFAVVGVPTNVVVIIGNGILSSAGVLKSDSVCDKRFTNSVKRSSKRPMRCDIRCISNFESTFISRTVAIKSLCANVPTCSRNPLSYVSDASVVRITVSRSSDDDFSSCFVPFGLSRSTVCRSSVFLRSDFESSLVSSIVSCRANDAGLGVNFCSFGKTFDLFVNEKKDIFFVI